MGGLDHESRERMTSLNWIRILLCGLVAGVMWNLLSLGVLALLAPEFVTSVQGAAPYQRQGGAYFFAVDMLIGVWAVWLYSAIVPRYGATLTTAAIVGVAWWILKTLQSAKWAGLGFMALGPHLLPMGVGTLGATVLASLIGAWLYRRVAASTRGLPAT